MFWKYNLTNSTAVLIWILIFYFQQCALWSILDARILSFQLISGKTSAWKKFRGQIIFQSRIILHMLFLNAFGSIATLHANASAENWRKPEFSVLLICENMFLFRTSTFGNKIWMIHDLESNLRWGTLLTGWRFSRNFFVLPALWSSASCFWYSCDSKCHEHGYGDIFRTNDQSVCMTLTLPIMFAILSKYVC